MQCSTGRLVVPAAPYLAARARSCPNLMRSSPTPEVVVAARNHSEGSSNFSTISCPEANRSTVPVGVGARRTITRECSLTVGQTGGQGTSTCTNAWGQNAEASVTRVLISPLTTSSLDKLQLREKQSKCTAYETCSQCAEVATAAREKCTGFVIKYDDECPMVCGRRWNGWMTHYRS
jgi:hypothetical protein